MVVGALVIALFISCGKNPAEPETEYGDVPTATGSPATVGNAEFEGTLNNISLTGKGWTKEQVDMLVNANPFTLVIEDNKVGCSYIMQKQLLCPDSSNPNVVEASHEEEVAEEGGGKSIFTAYIKITLDDTNNPTTATVEYHFKLYSSEYSYPGRSDTVIARYEGTLNKVTSSGI